MTAAGGTTYNKKTTTKRSRRNSLHQGGSSGNPVQSNGSGNPVQSNGSGKAARSNGSPRREVGSQLQQSVAASLTEYFEVLDGETTQGLYDLVMGEVERPVGLTAIRVGPPPCWV
jgi:hypothetical protein